MAIDPGSVKEFFDPHPGFAGAMIPIPEPVRLVANKLAGKRMPLREAVAQIKAVTEGEVSVHDSFVGLKISEKDGWKHMFRVIRFK